MARPPDLSGCLSRPRELFQAPPLKPSPLLLLIACHRQSHADHDNRRKHQQNAVAGIDIAFAIVLWRQWQRLLCLQEQTNASLSQQSWLHNAFNVKSGGHDAKQIQYQPRISCSGQALAPLAWMQPPPNNLLPRRKRMLLLQQLLQHLRRFLTLEFHCRCNSRRHRCSERSVHCEKQQQRLCHHLHRWTAMRMKSRVCLARLCPHPLGTEATRRAGKQRRTHALLKRCYRQRPRV